jgi:hypothetical protein
VNGKYLLSALPFLLISIPCCFAQDNPNSISVTAMQGITIFTPDSYQPQGYFYGAEIAYRLNMANNNAAWVKDLNIKDIAFTAAWFNLHAVSINEPPEIKGALGNVFGGLTILDMSLFETGRITFYFSPGMGFIYSTQTYYTNNNPIVGSHINLAVQAGFKMETPLSSTTKLAIGANFFHYSNSGFRLPNEGVNNINATVGIARNIDVNGPDRKKETFRIDDRQSFEFGIGAGRRGFVNQGNYINPQTGKTIPLPDSAAQRNATSNLYMLGLYAGYSYRFNSLFSLKAGTDMVYYTHTFSWNNFYRTYQETGSSFDNQAWGLSLGTDVWMGRMALMFNYGYYLHFNTITPDHFYWTIGGKYYLNNWMALNVKMYIHGFDAHYANFGLVFNVD